MRAPRGRSPTIERQVVVLPLPDSPTSPSVSPSRRLKLTRSTALTTRVPPNVKKWVWRSETSRTAVTRSPNLAGFRGAPRLRRGVPSVGGYGGPFRGAAQSRGAPRLRRGVPSDGGYGGPSRGAAQSRGAPRLRRGVPSDGGYGGPSRGAPQARRPPRLRRDVPS